MTNGTQWRSWLAHDYWFNELPAFLQDSLLVGMRQRRVTPGKLIMRRGEASCGLYALLAGSIRFNDISQQCRQRSQSSSARPYWFGEVSLFDHRPSPNDVFAEDQVILLHMPHQALLELLQQHPHHWRSFRKLLAQKLGVSVPPVEQVTSLPTDERVAFRLLLLTEGYGEIDRSARVVTIADVLSREGLGLTPEVVDTVLAQFAGRGILHRDQDSISILDTDRLRKAARHRLTEPTP